MALPLSYNVRNIVVRWQVTLLAVGGIALVVAVLLVLTAMANGFRMALRATGSPQNAIVTQRGSTGELTSGMSPRQRQHDRGRLARRPRRARHARWPRRRSSSSRACRRKATAPTST